MKRNKKNGFTLVELLAVIVILAIILVIAVPKVMDVIKDSKKATLESTAKMIASSAEKLKVQNDLLGKTEELDCNKVAKINNLDYADCDIDFDGNTAKVTIVGGGKFEGLYVCGGTKTVSTATDEECSGSTGSVEVGEFGTDSWETIVAAVQQAQTSETEYPYNVGDEKTVDMDVDGNGTAEQYTIRIANKTKCSTLDAEGKSVTSKTACGFVLEFKDIIKKMKMRDTDTNAGGWPATNVRTYLNNENDITSLYNLLPAALSVEIINTYVVSSHGSSDTSGNLDDDNFGYDDKLYLLSIYEVYGSGSVADTAATNTITRQLDYYKDNEVTEADFEGAAKTYGDEGNYWWWLRSAVSNDDSSFFLITDNNNWGCDGCSAIHAADNFGGDDEYDGGISPAFRLGE